MTLHFYLFVIVSCFIVKLFNFPWVLYSFSIFSLFGVLLSRHRKVFHFLNHSNDNQLSKFFSESVSQSVQSLSNKYIYILIQPWTFFGRTDAEAEAPILWPPDAKSWLWKSPWCWGRLRARGEGDSRGWDG